MTPSWITPSTTPRINPSQFTVFVVEDDIDARNAIIDVVGTMNLRAVVLTSAEELLNAYDGKPGVLVCDIRIPGISGLELQKTLLDRGLFMPVVIVTSLPRVRHVVEAIKNGAITVVEKPFSSDELWLSLREAITAYERGYLHHSRRAAAKERYGSLTKQERIVVEMILENRTNKMIAKEMAVSVRTVEARRRKILDKMQAASIVDLVRFVDLAAEPDR